MKELLNKNSKIIRKILSVTLVFLHILTFGPIGEALADIAYSANYRLKTATTSGGSSNSKGSSSYSLAFEVTGEAAIGKLQSASYQLKSGFVYTSESNPPEFTTTISNQSWPKNESLQEAFDLDNYFESESTLTYEAFEDYRNNSYQLSKEAVKILKDILAGKKINVKKYKLSPRELRELETRFSVKIL